jgi:hypothetical protein
MKKTLLSLSCFMMAFMAHAQTPVPTYQWAKNMGGTSDDFGLSVTADASGNVYTTGFFQGTADLDPSSATLNLSSAGSDDIFISKLDASGNFVWAKKFGASGSDKGNSIAVDASGNVYATGWFNGTVDFDPSASVTFNLTSAGNTDAFIVKLDATGNFVWAKQIGSSGGDNGRGIVLDASGNVYSTGNFSGTVDFDPSAATFTVASAGAQDAYISKLDGAGNFVWAKTLGGTADDKGFSVDLDASGNVFVTGEFAGTCDMDPGAAVANLVSGGATDIFISKLDASGNYVWGKAAMSGTSDDWATALKVDAGNVYVSGQFTGTADADPGAATFTFTSNGAYDTFVSKLDAAGSLLWSKQIGGTSDDVCRAIAVDGTGKVYLTGGFQNTVDFDPAVATTYTLTSNGGSDIFILNLDASGNYIWAGQIGGSGYDDAFYISSDAAANISVTGTFKVAPDFNPNISPTRVNTLTSAGNGDIFSMKMFLCASPTAATNATPVSKQTICVNTTATLTATGTGTVSWFSSATSTLALGTGTNYTTPVMAAGNYTYYAEASTCAPSATRTAITLTVNALPVVTGNNGTICQGQSFTILPAGAATYIYSSGSAIVTPTATTFYSIIGFDAIGCTSLPAVSIVTVMPSPAITASSSSSLICVGETATLTASGVSSYTWSTGSNAASIVVSPTVNTTYSVSSIGTNGCSRAVLLTQNVSLCTGLDEQKTGSASLAVIYPNPSNGVFTVEADEAVSVSVYDVLGNILYSQQALAGKQSIDLNHYANGIYVVKVARSGQVQNIRLIKQ